MVAVAAVEALACDAVFTTAPHREDVARAIAGAQTNARGGQVALVSCDSPASAVSQALPLARAGRRAAIVLGADELPFAIGPLVLASAERAPIVVHVLAHRADAAGARPGRDELAPVLDAGVGVVVSANAQEATDLALAIRRAAEDSETPFVHVIDAPHGAADVALPERALVETFLGPCPDPRTGASPAPTRAAAKKEERAFAARAPFALKSAMRALGEWTGRPHKPILRVHDADAEEIVVAVGGAISAALPVIAQLRADGRRIGLVGVCSLRPFFAADLVKAVARAQAILVLEPLDVALAPAGPVATALKAAFADALTWTPGFPGVGKIPPIVSATVATLDEPLGEADVRAAIAELEEGERARRTIVFGTCIEEARPKSRTLVPVR